MAILQKWCVRTVPSLEDGQQEYWQKMEKDNWPDYGIFREKQEMIWKYYF